MRKISVALLFGFCSNALFAQPDMGPRGARQNSERFEALRMAFITEALDLTTAEAEVFWPVMREHQLEMKTAQSELDSLSANILEGSKLSDAECLVLMDRIHELRVEELTAHDAWIREVADILDPQRAVKLPILEERFRKRIFQELQNRSNPRRPSNRRGPR